MQEPKKPNMIIVGIIVVVLIGAVASGSVYLASNKGDKAPTQTADKPSIAVGDTPPPASRTYKDGTYTASGEYLSPGGNESVDIEVTLTRSVVTVATVAAHPASDTSVQYQAEFTNNFKPFVVGKNINDIKLSHVAGSSLTSGGFNEALQKIKTEAAA